MYNYSKSIYYLMVEHAKIYYPCQTLYEKTEGSVSHA